MAHLLTCSTCVPDEGNVCRVIDYNNLGVCKECFYSLADKYMEECKNAQVMGIKAKAYAEKIHELEAKLHVSENKLKEIRLRQPKKCKYYPRRSTYTYHSKKKYPKLTMVAPVAAPVPEFKAVTKKDTEAFFTLMNKKEQAELDEFD